MALRFITVCFCCLLAGVASTSADDWFVDNISGNDRASGDAESLPLKTIQAALLRARPGDRIILRKTAEPYREQISISGPNNSGMPGMPFEIVGNGATLDGTVPIPGTAWEPIGDDMFQYRPHRLSHQLLFLDGRPLRKVSIAPGGKLELQPLQWTQVDGWIVIRTEPGKAPYQYQFSCCLRPVGVTLFRVHDVLITDLIVQGFQIDGINANDLVDDAVISQCILRGNGRSGLSAGGTSRLDLVSSLVGDNGRSQIRSEGLSRLNIENCDILDQSEVTLIDAQGGKVTRDGTLIGK